MINDNNRPTDQLYQISMKLIDIRIFAYARD